MTGGVRRKCGSVWNRIGSLAHRTQEFCEETLLVCSFFLQHELERTLLSLWLSSSWCSVYLCVVSDSVAVSREIRCGDVEISRNLGGMGIGSKAIIRSLCFVTYALPSCSTFFGQRAKLPCLVVSSRPSKGGGVEKTQYPRLLSVSFKRPFAAVADIVHPQSPTHTGFLMVWGSGPKGRKLLCRHPIFCPIIWVEHMLRCTKMPCCVTCSEPR